ncbi:GNAT family N-acetyltransferase [Bacillus sp. JJ1773]|uniref:GNAT family N-acetyltransferase n=1 Tax=Bacillus sp. JJ1773 TaxID=3122965 RepID=UPI002FFF92A0
MKLEYLNSGRMGDFISYCKKHKMEIDDSYLYDEDLASFEVNDENPTYIISDQTGEIVAAASLIIDDYYRRGRKARFRIFHSEIADSECYSLLMQAIKKHTEGLDQVFVFIPLENEPLMKSIAGLDFTVERYSYLLVRGDLEIPPFALPINYEIKSFRPGIDEEVWCEVRNAGFAKLQGSETPVTPEMVTKMISASDYLEDGMKILYHGEKPIGVARGSKDEYEDSPIMNIGPLAILPDYQGQGLGRSLLRAALDFAKKKSYNRTVLCVNAENERAKALYVQEGFEQVHAVACYKYNLL